MAQSIRASFALTKIVSVLVPLKTGALAPNWTVAVPCTACARTCAGAVASASDVAPQDIPLKSLAKDSLRIFGLVLSGEWAGERAITASTAGAGTKD
ncbi:hypothetical protein NJ75_02550 [Novosphingobium subterraneum]|uniref:Uncharacterized protein n=1 Tax=Novosphingobium subterraneum TaxID=48936 RepID=A0A0B9A4P0_9SPHN|nr:hypothetical protein NJ75_02550 [Novosphingobium subterraneum]